MAKQTSVKSSTPPPTKAASGTGGTGGKGAPAQTIKSISGPSLKATHVGPTRAPYFQK